MKHLYLYPWEPFCLLFLTALPVHAQTVVPAADGTATLVTQDGQRYIIDGGSLSGDGQNLFHSFQEFGLNSSQIADFLANPTLRNILGRVTGGSPSTINGLLRVSGGNANLFLMNPSGIVFGPNASLDVVGSFTATTATGIGFAGGWFNAAGPNDYTPFSGTPNQFAFDTASPGSLFNAGDLAVPAGETLMLLGGFVLNTGSLTAPGGNITIAAVPGESLVRMSQDGMLLNLEIGPLARQGAERRRQKVGNSTPHPTPLSLPALLTEANLGHASGITIDANGTVRLTGSGFPVPTDPGTTIVSGQLDVSSPHPTPHTPHPNSQIGGNITLLGNQIGLISAEIDASGPQGGGNVRIGGDVQGTGPLPRASQVIIDENSTITVDALESGDGGRTIAWADELTRFYGNISARGGPNGGDGGFVEVSGKELLLFTGTVDAAAPLGNPGTLLLDPKNVTISDATVPVATLFNPNLSTSGSDGFSFSIAAVGSDLLIGARNATAGGFSQAGQAFLFDASGALLQSFDNPNPTVDGRFGAAVAAAGNDLLISARGNPSGGVAAAGQAFLFNRNGTLLQSFDNPNPSNNGRFGRSVAIAGSDILIGADRNDFGGSNNVGQAFLFDRSGALLQTFDNPQPVNGGNFGRSVAIAGSNVLIGADGNDAGGVTEAGQAFLFNRNGALLQSFDNPNPVNNGRFGRSVAIADSGVLIGADRNTAGGVTQAGQAFLFDTSGALLQTFNNPNPVTEGNFGTVAFVDSDVLIGADSNTAGGMIGAGQAFLFDRDGTLLQTFAPPNPSVKNFGRSVGAANGNPLIGAAGGQTLLFPGEASFSNVPAQDFTLAASNLTTIANRGTDVQVQANNDITIDQAIAIENAAGDGGSLTLQAGRSIAINADISTDNGDLILRANEGTASGTVSRDRDPGAASITTAPGVILDAGTGSLMVTLAEGEGLANNARGDISLGTLIAGRVRIQNDGDSGGSVTTGDITTNGGSIDIFARQSITAGFLDSSSATGNGGDVTLDPIGDVQVTAINAQGGTGGTGGTVDVTAGQFFRATGSFTDHNGILASISSAGGQGGGAITLRHGGGGMIPFIVGDAAINGTAAAITSGDFIIESLSVLPFTTTVGNIEIISVNPVFDRINLDFGRDFSFPFEAFFPNSGNLNLLADLENHSTSLFDRYLEQDPTSLKTRDDAQSILRNIEQATGAKPALIYVFFTPQTAIAAAPTAETKSLTVADPAQNGPGVPRQFMAQKLSPSPEPTTSERNRPIQADDPLNLVLVTAKGEFVQRRVPGVTRRQVEWMAARFRRGITDPLALDRATYFAPAQQFYQWLVAPLEADLAAHEIDNLVFVLDSGLRSLPLAALHDGDGFLVERYSVGLMPSLSLTDTRYANINNVQVLAMGAAEFPDQDQKPLPGVTLELAAITDSLWPGRSVFNQNFTAETLHQIRRVQPFGILHLATHAEFLPGSPSTSYIQWWDERTSFNRLRQEVQFYDPPIELLVLSACKTAIGDPEAELGFAGMAVQSGVKTALGSLWYVSDEGTIGLMTNFYGQLKEAPIKAEALRRAQVAMLRGEVRLEGGQLVTPVGQFPLPSELAHLSDRKLNHPYYWSAFTMIGNPW